MKLLDLIGEISGILFGLLILTGLTGTALFGIYYFHETFFRVLMEANILIQMFWILLLPAIHFTFIYVLWMGIKDIKEIIKDYKNGE